MLSSKLDVRTFKHIRVTIRKLACSRTSRFYDLPSPQCPSDAFWLLRECAGAALDRGHVAQTAWVVGLHIFQRYQGASACVFLFCKNTYCPMPPAPDFGPGFLNCVALISRASESVMWVGQIRVVLGAVPCGGHKGLHETTQTAAPKMPLPDSAPTPRHAATASAAAAPLAKALFHAQFVARTNRNHTDSTRARPSDHARGWRI